MNNTYVINGYSPKGLFERFEDICASPHGSGNERKIADYVVKFASERGHYAYRDASNNVLVRRKASPGYENRPPVLLQGHLDMVCEKTLESNHDFTKDGLKLIVRNGYVSADGTTLGADDGIAVAMMLQLLSDPELSTPELECLFTTDEEVGMTGAKNFDYTKLHSRRMINIDAGAEHVVVSCAGGQRTGIYTSFKRIPYYGDILELTIGGLAGGHSGIDIDKGRGNAILITAGIIKKLRETLPAFIIKMEGGGKENAIPRNCTTTLAVNDARAAVKVVSAAAAEVKKKLSADDAGFYIVVNPGEYSGKAPSPQLTDSLLSFLSSIKNGVISMCDDIDLVKTSQNCAVVNIDGNRLRIRILSRSSDSSDLLKIRRELTATTKKYGFRVRHSSGYPGWLYEKESPLRDTFVDVYKKMFGKKPPIIGVHAGLECGIIKSFVPDMDIVATGCATYDEHTPDERLDLASCERMYAFLSKLLAQL
jgi:dipeptidase D